MEYFGKKKCKILKQIRAEIAKNNDIDWVVEECPHKGDCRGTCPKCEAEVRELERQLATRRKLGKAVVLTGVAAGIAIAVSGCGNDKNAPVLNGDLMPDPERSFTNSSNVEGAEDFENAIAGDLAPDGTECDPLEGDQAECDPAEPEKDGNGGYVPAGDPEPGYPFEAEDPDISGLMAPPGDDIILPDDDIPQPADGEEADPEPKDENEPPIMGKIAPEGVILNPVPWEEIQG